MLVRRLSRGLPATLLALLACGCGNARPTNVLLITIDTLRADHLGCYGFALARTPEIDRLAAEGVLAVDAAATAPITLPSHSSIMTGLLPPAHGVRDNGAYALGEDALTLAERLQAAGYRTHAVVSALVLNRRYNLDQGFEEYDDDLWSEDEPKLFMIRDRPAPRTAARAVRWLESWREDRAGKPFFLWVHFFDPHQPHQAPQAIAALAASPYDAEITVADSGVGRLLAYLRSHGELDDTLVVLTADHGESLGEHGEKTHAVFIYDATVRVPLLLRLPRLLERGSRYEGPVSSIDLLPTILAAVGLEAGDTVQGENLWPALRGEAPAPPQSLRSQSARVQYLESLLSEVGFGMAPLYGVRQAGCKWIRAPKPELYDLGRDPHELHNLHPTELRRASELNRMLDELLADSARRALATQENPMDRETLENLQALGYLASDAERRGMAGIDPKDGIVLYNQLEDARHEAQKGRWVEAERLLRAVLAETPANVSARNILALTRLRQGDLDGAREEYLRSLVDDPGQARVYAMLGNLSMIRGDLDDGERHLEKALAIMPGFVEAASNLGMIAALRGNVEEAEQRYREALRSDPGFHRVYRRLADLYYERGDFTKALVQYQKTLALEPEDFDASLQAGNCARRTGDSAGAASYFAAAAKLRPDSWLPTYNLACLAAVSGERQEALTLLAKSVEQGLLRRLLVAGDPDLTSLHGTPGFESVLKQLED